MKHEIDEHSEVEKVRIYENCTNWAREQIEDISKAIDLSNIELDKQEDQFDAQDLNETNLNYMKKKFVCLHKKFCINLYCKRSILQNKMFSFKFPTETKIENVFGKLTIRDLISGGKFLIGKNKMWEFSNGQMIHYFLIFFQILKIIKY